MRKLTSYPADSSFVEASPRIAFIRQARTILRRVLLGLAIVATVSFFSWSIWFVSTGNMEQWIEKQIHKWYHLTMEWGFIVENVYLEGQYYSSTETLLKHLQIKQGMPIIALPLKTMRNRLEALEWIDYAIIERVYPNSLHIRVVEHEPVALWQYQKKLSLINAQGGIIHENDLLPFTHFIILVGESAPLHADHFLQMVATTPELKEKITSAIRVGERRWNVRFSNGLSIKLPEKDPQKAWKYLAELYNNKDIFNGETKSIDLRVPGKVFLQPANGS